MRFRESFQVQFYFEKLIYPGHGLWLSGAYPRNARRQSRTHPGYNTCLSLDSSWNSADPIRLCPSRVWSWRKLMKGRSSVNDRWHGIPQSKQVALITLDSEILHSSDALLLHHLHHISRSLSSCRVLNRGLPSFSKHIGSLISICSTSWSMRTGRLCMARGKSVPGDLQTTLLREKCSLRVLWSFPERECLFGLRGKNKTALRV